MYVTYVYAQNFFASELMFRRQTSKPLPSIISQWWPNASIASCMSVLFREYYRTVGCKQAYMHIGYITSLCRNKRTIHSLFLPLPKTVQPSKPGLLLQQQQQQRQQQQEQQHYTASKWS